MAKQSYIEERRRKEKQQRERQILRAAKKVFVKKGFRAATMEEIARIARLSKAALYLYFPSKEDLYLEVVYSVFQHFFQFAMDHIPKDLPPDRVIYHFGRVLLLYAQEQWDQYILAAHFNLAEVAARVERQRVEKLDQLLKEYLEFAMQIVERGKQQGIFRNDLDSCLAILSLWVSINGAILQWHFGKPTFLSPQPQLEEFVEFLLQNLLRGFAREQKKSVVSQKEHTK